MSRFLCVSCGATYRDKQIDGVPYYHVCPEGTVKPRNENIDPVKGGRKLEGRGVKEVM